MKRIYNKPKLIVHGSIKEITRLTKNPGSSDAEANASQGSGFIGDED